MVTVFQKLKRGRKSFRSVGSRLSPASECLTEDSASVASWGGESLHSNRCVARGPLQRRAADTSVEDESITATQERNNAALEDPSILTMVVYQQPPTATLPDSVSIWFTNLDAVLRTQEMDTLMRSSKAVIEAAAISSKHVVYNVGETVVYSVCLPLTVPLSVMSLATGVAFNLADTAGGVIFGTNSSSNNGGERSSSQTSMEGIINALFEVVPTLVNTAETVTRDIGSLALGVVSPVLGLTSEQSRKETHKSVPTCQASAGKSSTKDEDVLDRLRLDFMLSPPDDPVVSVSTRATAADFSKFLIRVDDVNVMVSPDPASSSQHHVDVRVTYVDLGKEFFEKSITADALSQLMQLGLDVTSTNVDAHIALPPSQRQCSLRVDWKAEGSTQRMLRNMSQASAPERLSILQKQVLIWSGNHVAPSRFNRTSQPIFMARGIVKRSPEDFMNMLWDSERTSEYNKHSLGRYDVRVLDNQITRGGSSGAKIIRSETNVPFTSFTLSLSVLMHVQELEGEEGYAIVSRSLDTGMAGCHTDASQQRVEKCDKSEILLGVNIMRPVPGHPGLTDLFSVSQVNSSMIPQFLAFRIGMMGVDDFFKNVRV